MLKYLSLVILLFPLLFVFAQNDFQRIFPQPNEVLKYNGSFSLSSVIKYSSSVEVMDKLKYITNLFYKKHGLLFVKSVSEKKNVDLVLVQSNVLPDEGYLLQIKSDGIRINYKDRKGLIYAFLTLDQWIGAQRTNVNLDYVRINDAPKFNYRGMHLDCSRHFFTISEVKSVIDVMTSLKLNKFHWHLTDDQGWRIEIKKFPKLHEIGGWRDSTLIGHYGELPEKYERKKYGGFYTQNEIKDIINYAAERGIDIIPEIELPGHARAALAAYPELGCKGIHQNVPGTWGVFDDVFCTKDSTLNFLEEVLTEVAQLFPSQIIHVGGDEVPKLNWSTCEQCKLVKDKNNLRNDHELQSYVIKRMSNHLTKLGKQLMGWDEILEGGLASNAMVMSWRGTEGGIVAAKAKHKVVMTPTSHCYFDYYQSSNLDEPLAIGGLLPLEKVYEYDVIPAEMNLEDRKYIIGAQANLWTEYIPDFNTLTYFMLPRLVALSQVVWTKTKPDYSYFVNGLVKNYLPTLDDQKINYSFSFANPKVELDSSFKSGVRYYSSTVVPLQEMKFENGLSELILDKSPKKEVVSTKATVFSNKTIKRVVDLNFVRHLGLGIKIDFKTPPNSKYNIHTSLGLTDGVVGQIPWKGDQWLGFTTDTVEYEVDLNSADGANYFELGFLHEPGSWIYRPEKIIVEGKFGQLTYQLIKDLSIKENRIGVEFDSNYTSLKIRVINKAEIPIGFPGAGTVPWTFIDEMILEKK